MTDEEKVQFLRGALWAIRGSPLLMARWQKIYGKPPDDIAPYLSVMQQIAHVALMVLETEEESEDGDGGEEGSQSSL